MGNFDNELKLNCSVSEPKTNEVQGCSGILKYLNGRVLVNIVFFRKSRMCAKNDRLVEKQRNIAWKQKEAPTMPLNRVS